MLVTISMDVRSSRNTNFLEESIISLTGVRNADVFINGANSRRVSAVIDDNLIDATSFVKTVQQYDEEEN